MESTVSSVALRFALRKIAEIGGYSTAERVLVKVVPGGTHRVYVAVIPIEHCEPVYQYISKYAQVPAPNAGDPLILTAVQAKRVIDAAYGFVAPHQHPQLTEHEWEKSNAN
jgi:hypothetical protein